jgi:hypothetical protein
MDVGLRVIARYRDGFGALLVELTSFVQEPLSATEEWANVRALAERLLLILNEPATLTEILAANRPAASSAEVQATFRGPAEALGFHSERKGLFADSISGLRPDYFTELNGAGILLEVERGKTTTNNMDLLDFWKCHISGTATYLFLLVPKALQHNDGMTPKKEYASVARRLAQFFVPGKYTNVRGLCLFGY